MIHCLDLNFAQLDQQEEQMIKQSVFIIFLPDLFVVISLAITEPTLQKF